MLFGSQRQIRQSPLQLTMPNSPCYFATWFAAFHWFSNSAACFFRASWSVTAVLLADTVNSGRSVGGAPDGMLIMLIGEFAGWLLTVFNPISTSSRLRALVATLNGLQYWNTDKHGMNLVIMEPNPQNLKTTARSSPIPEIDPKFLIQLPILDKNDMWGASWRLSSTLLTCRLLVKSAECCSWTAANISAIAAAGLIGLTFRAGCMCKRFPSDASTSYGIVPINLSPCTRTDGSIGTQVPFLNVCDLPLKFTKSKCQ
jgi:hypothetical protein